MVTTSNPQCSTILDHAGPPESPAASLETSRRGITLPEVLVVVVVVSILLLAILSALPRQRENARMANCQRSLMQIGIGIALYDRSEGRLPTIPTLVAEPARTGGPLKALLEALALPDLTELTDVATPPKPRPGEAPGEHLIPGFVCQSDPGAFAKVPAPAPVSYRATTGDEPSGENGGFAPGRPIRLAEIDDGDGTSYTAAFSERLIGVGEGGSAIPTIADYSVVRGPLEGAACPNSMSSARRRDAGWSWAEASWRSTLYNHAVPPGFLSSCIAEDGASALLGASSGHVGGVNVLMFDQSVRTVSRTVALPIWKALATTHSPAQPEPAPRAPASDATPKEPR
jgi:prepilin-type N-terminal cleavage/methylation domain-containing protein